MPKASKSKARHPDFQKRKLKLGKGKQQANNATDTSFRSRTIALPQQSINRDNSARLVTSRNLGVTQLSQQLRHFGAGVRREAVVGIWEILTLHPGLIHSAVGQLIPDLCRVLSDDDQAVRRNLYALLAWYLPQIPSILLAPYLNALLLFTSSALSHIYPEVRLDALSILDVLIQIAPASTTTGWQDAIFAFTRQPSSNGTAAASTDGDQTSHGERFVNCYLNLLGITRRSGAGASSLDKSNGQQRTASTTVTDLAPAAKLLVFKSLRSFLVAAAARSSSSAPRAASAASSQATAREQGQDAAAAAAAAAATASSCRQAATQINDCPTWFFRSSFRDDADFEAFQGLMRPDLRKRGNRDFAVLGHGDAHGDGSASTASAAPSDALESGSGSSSKRQKRKHAAAAAAAAGPSTPSDFLSADFGADSLIDVATTVGRGWATGDLFSSLVRAAASDASLRPHAGGSSRPGPGGGSTDADISPSLHLFSLLQPVMVATFLDTAPTAFRPDMDLHAQPVGRSGGPAQNAGLSTQAEIVSHLVALCITLWRASISSSSSSSSSSSASADGASPIVASRVQKGELASFLGHAATYFPFSQQAGSSMASQTTTLSQKARMTLIEMDLGFSELTALLALSLGRDALAAEGSKPHGAANNRKLKINLAAQLGLVSSYISELLATSAAATAGAGAGAGASDGSGTVSLSGGGASLDTTTYESLLPTVWLLLNTATACEEQGTTLLDAVLEHYTRSGSSSKVKALAFEFVARLCTLQTFASYDAAGGRKTPGGGGGGFWVQEGSGARMALGRWIESLPRYLWEATSWPSAYVGGSGEGATTPHKVLELLRYLVVVSSRTNGGCGIKLSTKEVRAVREKLAPYFCIQHPTKKSKVAGPFGKLHSVEERKEALALVEWLGCRHVEAAARPTTAGDDGVARRLSDAVQWATAAAGV